MDYGEILELKWSDINSKSQVMLLQDSIGEHLLEVDKVDREWEEIILKELIYV